jgi:hypothetical protein
LLWNAALTSLLVGCFAQKAVIPDRAASDKIRPEAGNEALS